MPLREDESLLTRSEHVLEEVLKKDLEDIQECRNATYDEIMHAMKLQENLKVIEGKRKLETLIPIGCELFMEAHVNAKSASPHLRLFVETGFQFFLEMTNDEAVQFLSKKLEMLQGRLEFWTYKAAHKKMQIQSLLQAIAMMISPEDDQDVIADNL